MHLCSAECLRLRDQGYRDYIYMGITGNMRVHKQCDITSYYTRVGEGEEYYNIIVKWSIKFLKHCDRMYGWKDK